MMHQIASGRFCLRADETGAQLASFVERDARGEYEYIWQKSSVWNGQSPLLFPVVGRLRQDRYTWNGREYRLEKHGFASRMDFALEKRAERGMTFLLRDSAATRDMYPFSFALRVQYRLEEDGFTMEHRVCNAGEETMFFSIGAHPGFQCAMGDKIVLDEAETADAFQLDEDALRARQTVPVLRGEREIVIGPETFAHDALIFDGLRSGGASLVRANGRNVHVDFGGAPFLGLWAKPGAEYVCIEPWYGIDDRCDAGGDLPCKERILSLAPGGEFVFPVRVHVG